MLSFRNTENNNETIESDWTHVWTNREWFAKLLEDRIFRSNLPKFFKQWKAVCEIHASAFSPGRAMSQLRKKVRDTSAPERLPCPDSFSSSSWLNALFFGREFSLMQQHELQLGECKEAWVLDTPRLGLNPHHILWSHAVQLEPISPSIRQTWPFRGLEQVLDNTSNTLHKWGFSICGNYPHSFLVERTQSI